MPISRRALSGESEAWAALTMMVEPNSRRMLPGGALQGRTDFGAYAYGGPCPPPGKPHHYHFRLYALKVPKLDVPNDASAALIGFNVHANQIGTTEIMATYSR